MSPDPTIQHLNLLILSSRPQPRWMTLEDGAYVGLEGSVTRLLVLSTANEKTEMGSTTLSL